MGEQPASNPFVPGRGNQPPYLAGRDAEQHELSELAAYLADGRGAPRDVVLSGPRGNGKTVLLRWFERHIEASGAMDVIWRTPSDLPSLDALANSLVPPGRFKAMLPDTLSVSIGIGRLGWELGGDTATLADLLTLRCRHRPLAMLIDEAHALDVEVGHALLNARQAASAVAPFLLALAGTPGLELRLNAMSATFWNRAKQIGVGLLTESAAADALARPFERQRPSVTFEEAALNRVVAESQCYPYFIQLWGASIWDAARKLAATRIDERMVDEAAAPSPRNEPHTTSTVRTSSSARTCSASRRRSPAFSKAVRMCRRRS